MQDCPGYGQAPSPLKWNLAIRSVSKSIEQNPRPEELDNLILLFFDSLFAASSRTVTDGMD